NLKELEQQRQQETAKNRIFNRFNLGISAIGLGSSVVGIIGLLPFIAFPPAIPFVLGGLGLLFAAVAITQVIVNQIQIHRELTQAKQQCDTINVKASEFIKNIELDEMEPSPSETKAIHSEAHILQELMEPGASIKELEKLTEALSAQHEEVSQEESTATPPS